MPARQLLYTPSSDRRLPFNASVARPGLLCGCNQSSVVLLFDQQAHTVGAILLASAAVPCMRGFLATTPSSHDPAGTPRLLTCRQPRWRRLSVRSPIRVLAPASACRRSTPVRRRPDPRGGITAFCARFGRRRSGRIGPCGDRANTRDRHQLSRDLILAGRARNLLFQHRDRCSRGPVAWHSFVRLAHANSASAGSRVAMATSIDINRHRDARQFANQASFIDHPSRWVVEQTICLGRSQSPADQRPRAEHPIRSRLLYGASAMMLIWRLARYARDPSRLSMLHIAEQ